MTGEPALFKLRARVGDADTPRLDVSFSVDVPGVIGVIGPNGAGKTTLLRAIAGLEDLDGAATVQVRDRNVTDQSPSRRRVAYVPQSGALFPHLSVLDNVAYGLRATGVRRSAAHERAQTYLRTLQIDDLADRSPHRLSGGQRQRVAIARALAVNPDVILLDEPTASLDAAGRVDVRAVLHRHLVDFPGVAILVTHDASEVLTLARRVLVLERGVVTQDASSAELIQRPGSRWLAQMLNLNAWSGVVASREAVGLDAGGVLHAVELPPTGTHVLATASPTSITLFAESPTGSARNVWAATVQEVSVLGDRVRVTFVATHPNAGPHETVAEVTREAASELAISQGTTVFAAIKATDLSVSQY